MDKVSMPHHISFSRYQTKCVIKFLIRQFMRSQTLRFFLNQPLSNDWQGKKEGEKKRGKRKYKNLNISRMKRAF